MAFIFPTTAGQFLAIFGLLLTMALYVRKIPGALLLGILITTLLGFPLGISKIPDNLTATPNFSNIGQLDVMAVWDLGALTAVLIIFSIMILDFFDTMGTVTAVGEQAGLTDEKGQVPKVGRILLVDSVAAAAGGVFGTSSNTSYIESSAGVGEGGRTGFASIVTGLLFLAAVFLAPLAAVIPTQATRPGPDPRRRVAVRADPRDRRRRRGTGHPGPVHDDPDAAHVRHRHRHRCRRHHVGLHQGRQGQVPRSPPADVGAAIAFLVFFLKDYVETLV